MGCGRGVEKMMQGWPAPALRCCRNVRAPLQPVARRPARAVVLPAPPTGCSMANSAMICRRWFWMTSRTMPYWSKYPPRPSVPKFSEKMTCRWQVGGRAGGRVGGWVGGWVGAAGAARVRLQVSARAAAAARRCCAVPHARTRPGARASLLSSPSPSLTHAGPPAAAPARCGCTACSTAAQTPGWQSAAP